MCSRYLSHVASTMSGSASLPRSTIAGGGGAETIVSSLGQATVSSRRTSTKTLAGITLRISQREWPTVFISVPHSGQTRISGETGFSTSTRSRYAGSAERPGCRPLRLRWGCGVCVGDAPLGGATPRSPSGSTSWRSRRSSVSERGRLRRRSASFFVSSPLTSQTRDTKATIAVTSSTKRSARIIFSRKARTSPMSGAYGEVIRGGVCIVRP